MKVPHTELSTEALRGIIEEFITREGTEYGARDYSLEEKVLQVMSQLERGDVIIDYDPDSGTCNLLQKHPAGSGPESVAGDDEQATE